MNLVVEQMMQAYESESIDEAEKLREVMQRIALAGLYRGDFFSKAAFYGGTCLRLFHGLPRFSEDMDFSLLKKDEEFQLEQYFRFIIEEFHALDLEVSIKKKNKNKLTAIESAFLKSDSATYDLGINVNHSAKIKLEIDTEPPEGFTTENKVSVLPFSFMTRCYTLPDLYAGKMHALLFRSWKNRVKGRDWFDFEWYVRRSVPLNFEHFQKRVSQQNPKTLKAETIETFKNQLRSKISTVDFSLAKRDVAPFIPNTKVLDIWSKEYFDDLVDLMKFKF